MSDTRTVTCHNCGYVWDTQRDTERVTCSDCDTKTPVDGEPESRHNWSVYKAAREVGK